MCETEEDGDGGMGDKEKETRTVWWGGVGERIGSGLNRTSEEDNGGMQEEGGREGGWRADGEQPAENQMTEQTKRQREETLADGKTGSARTELRWLCANC